MPGTYERANALVHGLVGRPADGPIGAVDEAWSAASGQSAA
ncbi:hypothetical protein [Streptomyces sp. WAC 01529]|nr:hypothetical protein [Streptomyces sp. WAC 01529]